MRAIIPDVASLSPDHPVHEKTEAVENRDSIAADKAAWAAERLVGIEAALANPLIVPRNVKPGNTSTYEHQQLLKQRFESDPEAEADAAISRANARIQRMDKWLQPKLIWQGVADGD